MAELEVLDRDYTVAEWCKKRRISEWKFNRMQASCTAPEIWRDGKTIRISARADREWEERQRERTRNPSKKELAERKRMRLRALNASRKGVASPKHVSRQRHKGARRNG